MCVSKKMYHIFDTSYCLIVKAVFTLWNLNLML